jgi:hypothetical protein
MLLARSLLLLGTLAVVATLWVTLLSGGGGRVPAVTPRVTTSPSGATSGAPAASGYSSAIGAAHSAVQQSNQE